MSLSKILALILLLVLLALVAIPLYGQSRWYTLTQELTDRLDAARIPPAPSRFDRAGLEALPPVVQRYFRTVLPENARPIRGVILDHAGTFNVGETDDQWKPFTSHQRVVTRRPGFVWDGRVRMMPGVTVHVHDAYVAGEGILHPALLGAFSLADMRGTDDLAQGELLRFLAEAAWYPTVLLPGQGVRWEAVDDHSARATLTDEGRSVTMTFTFDAAGLIESVRADARGRTVGGKVVMRPWEGRWSGYQLRDGMRVPMAGEVAWLLPEREGGRKAYWRGTVTRLLYEFAS